MKWWRVNQNALAAVHSKRESQVQALEK